METAYRDWARWRARPAPPSGRRGKVTLGGREKRRLIQLVICIALFLVVWIGKGAFPERVAGLREGLGQLIGSDVDFQAAFSGLGRSISNGEPVLETLGELCVQVFGGSRGVEQPPLEKLLPSYEAEYTFLSGPVTAEDIMKRRLGIKEAPAAEVPIEVLPETPPTETAPVEMPLEVPAVIPMEYSGPALPANATMDQYALEVGATVSPVEDYWISSAFGWREHPVEGGEKFHNGIDMAVNTGTNVRAFAGGTVDYIGESPIYGLYTQIRHANGVTSFYCHCDELLVQTGRTVAAGDVIARSGETGNALGPHLHFEIKKDDIFLNPSYYVAP